MQGGAYLPNYRPSGHNDGPRKHVKYTFAGTSIFMNILICLSHLQLEARCCTAVTFYVFLVPVQ